MTVGRIILNLLRKMGESEKIIVQSYTWRAQIRIPVYRTAKPRALYYHTVRDSKSFVNVAMPYSSMFLFCFVFVMVGNG